MKTQIIGLLLLLSMIYGCATYSMLTAANIQAGGFISGAGITVGASFINNKHTGVIK